MNYNKAIVIGRLTRDPELRSMPSGGNVCTFSVATNHVYNNQNTGQKVETTEYHNIVVFGKRADTVAQYMKKGNEVMVDGRLQTRSWDAKDGSKRSRTEIVAEKVEFGARPQTQSAPRPQQEVAPSDDFEASLQVPDEPASSNADDDIDVSQIPF